MRLRALAFALLALGGCKLFRRDPGRLVVRDGSGSSARLLGKHVDGKADDVLNVGGYGAVSYGGGEGLLTVGPSGLIRTEKGKTTNVACKISGVATGLATDDHGQRLLFSTLDGKDRETVHFMDLGSCAETTLVARSAYGGDVARDGSEAAVGAFPTSCAEESLNRCPITLYRLRPPGSPVPTEVLRAGPRAHYQPRYFPDGKLVFQTTELDASCDGTVNACRHDLVAIPVTGGPSSPLEVIRKGAVNASVSADGKRMAYLAYTSADASCHARLPCSFMTLRIGDWRTPDDSKDVSIAAGKVSRMPEHAFSADGRWIAFATGVDPEPQACRIDGTSCKKFAGTRVIGWMK